MQTVRQTSVEHVGSSEVRQSQRSSGPYIFAWLFFNSIVLFCNFPALKWAVLKTIQKGKKKMSKWFSLVFRFSNRNLRIIQWILFSSVVHWSTSTLTSYDVKLARLISLATHFQFGKKANLKKRGQHKAKLRRLNACRLIKHWSFNLETWGL